MERNSPQSQSKHSETALDSETDQPISSAFLPYPTQTLSPAIVPNDLTNFKSRGVSLVQKDTAQRLNQIKEEYQKVVENFNWNKIVYESEFSFEPVLGTTYYLYKNDKSNPKSDFVLSMIEPQRWKKPFIGSFTLGVDGKWIVEEIAENFSLQNYLNAPR